MGTGPASELDALLARHHVGLTSSDVLDELNAACAAVPGAGAAPMSAAELTFLLQHSGASAVADDWSADAERQSRSRGGA